ncbi:MAG: glycoside hydrolase family 3 C-terminal domain-containing protein [Oscillospiraceae bacterium]|jgi:beta-glucosidase|nr:glycoside hydrolase family 3 C-terminal domain-containing protein [Oscillospiraceae bacterium]MCI1990912.1 glycoside hydrolase family 3 C-terminal domain-containing protein [Oscillospiraceae bacterium]MCI2036139.1 glycoside hydrolase family 3 C-terminal domain-containing protein [Oscillospiraceae bacterium]
MKYQDTELSAEERARDLLSRLTVREKAGQLNQRLFGFSCYRRNGGTVVLTEEFQKEVERWGGLGLLYGLYRADPWSGRGYETGLDGTLALSAYNAVQKYVTSRSRFGIPALMSSECPHGHQALDGYLLPVALAMGASFDPELVRTAFAVCGAQMKALGVDLALVSVLDVLRDPRWGRSEECFGEDPVLCSRMAEAAVRGIRGQGIAAVAKHFCAQGEGTGGVNASAARIGERELREIHIPPAAAACRAGAAGIMAAYNEIDGLPCHANPHLLKDILRGELHFDGLVMADGKAVDRLDQLTGNPEDSGALALRSGVDAGLWDDCFSLLDRALEDGKITMEELDAAVLRVLKLKFSRGLFEKPYLEKPLDLDRFSYQKNSESLELARRSPVLLKNRGSLLPLGRNSVSSVAVIGPNADSLYRQCGDYTPPIRPGTGTTVLEGIRRAAGKNVRVETAPGCGKEAVEAAGRADVAILVLGGSSSRFEGAEFDSNGAAVHAERLPMDCGEGVDSATLSLSAEQTVLARAVFALGKPTVTVLVAGRPYAIPEIVDRTDALLYAFYPGPMGGQALGEILFGDVCPSGRLPVSIPRSAGQLPVYYNYKSSYDAMCYCDETHRPLFPFGFGLSYTEFQYSGFHLSSASVSVEGLKSHPVVLKFTVQNTGDREGWAVPSFYIHGLGGSVVRRKKELRAFEKHFLRPGESASVCLALNAGKLAVWDANMCFTVEPGPVALSLEDGGKQLWKGTLKIQSA